MCAEDNFATLNKLRPVQNEDGCPVMSSGNFAVVFKMKDITSKKCYAVKCFIKEQLGRDSAYKTISQELNKVTSEHIVSFQYLENELFVVLSGGEETEVPVVVMDWVDGVTLDSYIKQNIDEPFTLSYLAYQFMGFANWLLSCDFAHGDIKPDNLLVKKDCTIVMIDYDGMFMPSFKSNIVNEVGSPYYQHPQRTSDTFSKDIDDFSLLVILIEILLSKNHKELCSPIFTKQDYSNITEASVINRIFPSVEFALNIAVAELINSLLHCQIDIPKDTFNRLTKFVNNNYFEESNLEYKRLKKKYHDDKRYIWKFYTKGYQGKEECYPVLPSVYVEGYDYEHDGYPCVIKDGCLLHVCDWDGGSYMGDEWEEDWDLIVVPQNIVTIGDESFKGCSYTQFVVLPNSIRNIGDSAFSGCSQLQYIVLPDKIERVGKNLLNLWPQDYIESTGYKNLELLAQFEKDIIIPFSEIGHRRTFKDLKWTGISQEYMNFLDVYNESCCNFKNFLVPNGRKEYYQNLLPQYKDYIIEFSEYVNSEDTNINPLTACIAKKIGVKSSKIIKYSGNEEICVIPSNVRTICTHAFSENDRIKKVIIPNTVTSFGTSIFRDCKNLESITLPDNMSSIPNEFLAGCENLKEIILPSNIKSIGNNAFGYCKSLCKINIPSGVTHIGSNAFSHCTSLNSIILPSTVDVLGEHAFWGCDSLEKVILPGKMTKIGGNLFNGCKSLVSIEVPNGVTTIPTYCFYGCTSIRYIFLPNTIESISNEAFGGCVSLSSIALPSSLQKISCGAFYGSGLTEVRFPENIESIGYSAFKGCSKLRFVDIPSNTKLRKIEKFLFEGCESIEELNIPNCIENIEDWAFHNCKKLKQITLPSQLEKVENGLFSGCINLEYVRHIDSIVSIGQEAFFGCISLKQLTIPIGVTQIEHNSLCGVNINVIDIKSNHFEKDGVAIYTKGKKSLVEVLMISHSWTIPNCVEEIRAWAFNGCRFNKLEIPDSVRELCKDAFVSCSIDRIEINKLIKVHPSTFSKGIKEIAVPKHLVNYYKRAVLTPGGNSIYNIDKKIVSLE